MTPVEKYGSTQKHAGKLRGDGDSVWHTNQAGDYWCGQWHDRGPSQLYNECKTIIADLESNHPHIFGVKS